MIVNNAILHIMDFNSGVSVFSQKELDVTEENIANYIEKHVNKIMGDSGRQNGKFEITSPFLGLLQQYLVGETSFIDLSIYVANILYEQISQSDKLDAVDLFVADVLHEDVTYIAILLPLTKEAHTHYVTKNDNAVYSQLIKHSAILPNTGQKIESYVLINCRDFSIDFFDRKRIVNGADCQIFTDVLLKCSSNMSGKEAVGIVKKVAEKVAQEFGQVSTAAVSRAKAYLVENFEDAEDLKSSKNLDTQEIAREIFIDSPQMQEEFTRQVQEYNVPKEVKVDRSYAVKTGRTHKIKTDTGIEISFPSEYFDNNEFMQIINNPDGTISISLNNIGKITDK